MRYKTEQAKGGLLKLIAHLLTMPIIWLPLPFFILLDILMEFYALTCFPVYGIEKPQRSAYIQVLDRNKLQYLNIWEKFGCMYCGYVNGSLLYMKQIAGLTEKYFCGIMHANKPGFKTQQHQVEQDFAQFDDEKEFVNKYGK
jgi:hypothetical protein